MEVQVLSQKSKKLLEEKRLCCWGMIKDNLTELFEEFDVADSVAWIVDDNVKKQGTAVVCGKEIPVISSEKFADLKQPEIAIILTCDYHEEALLRFTQLKNFEVREENIFRFVNRLEQIDLSYRAKYQNEPLENIVIFRSGPYRKDYVKGTDFWDNSRALFDYMLAQGYNQKYKLVWLVKHPEEFAAYEEYNNVEFLSFDWEDSEKEEERERYYRALCLAKYIFTSDAYGFAKNARKDQVRIQLWHGCGFKTRNNFIRCEHRYDFTTVVSDLYAEIHANIYGLRKDQVLVTGYPKHDWLFQPYEQGLSEILGIQKAAKYVFWLPTFRIADDNISSLNIYEINPETGLPIVMNEQQMLRLNELLKELDITMIIKLHPLQKNVLVKNVQLSNISLFRHTEMLERGLALNRLLASADALISDYSSTAVDYLVLDRPMAFTLDDLDAYENSRGFVYDNIRDWLPGKEIFDFEEFCGFVSEIGRGEDSTSKKRKALAAKMIKYQDDRNSRRVLEAFGIEK